MHFQEDVVQWLVSRLESSNLRLLRGNTIGEILGDKDAKAIRIKDGKVISAQVIIFADCNEDLKLFTDTGLQINNGIEVNDQFRTNVDSIFALDQVSANRNSEPITPTAVLLEQGIAVAAAINGQHRSAEIPPVSLSLNVEGLVITVLGQTKPKSDTEIRRTFNKNAGYYKGLYLENDRLVGAVLINAESEKSNLEWLISEKSLVEPVNPELPFDEPTSQRHEVEQIGGQDVSTELVDN
jgi:nitrite reductase (NADH) large subunit